MKCNDCPADAELSGFGVRLCETCYAQRLKNSQAAASIYGAAARVQELMEAKDERL
jgi:hypothetical protein